MGVSTFKEIKFKVESSFSDYLLKNIVEKKNQKEEQKGKRGKEVAQKREMCKISILGLRETGKKILH